MDRPSESSKDSQGKLSEKYMQRLINITITVAQGFTFVHALPKECDWHYSGQGVTTAASDTPIFWYRPISSETYRIIYGDLKIEECLPDDVPEVPEEQKKKGVLNLILD